MSLTAGPVDLGGRIALAIDGAYERGFPMAVAYIDEDGTPSLSVRGSVLVLSTTEIGLWARKTDSGLAKAIATRPDMALMFFGTLRDGARMRMEIKGKARVDHARSAEVYSAMGDVERSYDPDARGVAIVVKVGKVVGMTEDGPFTQS